MEDRIKKYKRAVLQGNFTVELSLLMPLIFLVVFSVVSLSFYMHHKVWLTASAYEAAGVGACTEMNQSGKGMDAARQRANERFRDFFEGNADTRMQVFRQGEEIKVRYDGSIIPLYGGGLWQLKAEGQSRICRPAAFIRKVRALKGVGDVLGGLRDGNGI